MADDAPAHMPFDHRLPSEISLYVLRQLRGVDLLTACIASAAWWRLVNCERLWQQACQHRWPDAFVDGMGRLPPPAAVSAPIVMPEWVQPVHSLAYSSFATQP